MIWLLAGGVSYRTGLNWFIFLKSDIIIKIMGRIFISFQQLMIIWLVAKGVSDVILSLIELVDFVQIN